MRVLPVVFDGDSHVSEQDARALAIHEAVAPGVADHVERQWRDLKRVGLVAAVLVAVGVVLLATGQVASGGGLAALGVLGGLLGELFQRVFYAHAETHLDPPAASIVVTSGVVAALALVGVLPTAAWVPLPA